MRGAERPGRARFGRWERPLSGRVQRYAGSPPRTKLRRRKRSLPCKVRPMKWIMSFAAVTASLGLVGCEIRSQDEEVVQSRVVQSAGIESAPNGEVPISAAPPAEVDLIFVQTLMGVCVLSGQAMPTIDSHARVARWKEVTDADMLKSIAPVQAGAKWKTWVFKENGKGYVVNAGRLAEEDGGFPFCTVVSEPSNGPVTSDYVSKLHQAKLLKRWSEAGQNYTSYDFENDGVPGMISFRFVKH